MLPYIDQFYLPNIGFYVEGRDSPYFTDNQVITELKGWFQDKVEASKLDMVVEAGMSITSKFAPDCKSKAKFVAMAKFVIFGYIFDDIEPEQEVESDDYSGSNPQDVNLNDRNETGGKVEVFSQVADVVAGKRKPVTKLEKTVDCIYAELKKTCLPGPYMRHVFGFTSWAHTMKLEHSLQRKNTMNLDQFLEFRKDNGGFYGMTAILECLMDFDINDIWQICLPIYQDVYTHLMLINDLYSFRKEYYQNDTTNILSFLILNYHRTISEAIDNVIDLVNNLKFRIQTHINKVLKVHQNDPFYPKLYNYFKALELLTAGNLLHSKTITRYHGTTKKVGYGILIMHPKNTIIVKPNSSFLNNHCANFLLGFQLDPRLL